MAYAKCKPKGKGKGKPTKGKPKGKGGFFGKFAKEDKFAKKGKSW